MVNNIQLVGCQFKLFYQWFIAFNEFCCRKSQRQSFAADFGFDQVGDRMNCHMSDAWTKVESFRHFFITSGFLGAWKQFVNAGTWIGCDWDDRYGKAVFSFFDIDRTAAGRKFIHHIQGHDHRGVEFDELQGKIETAFNIGSVDNVDDDIRFAA